MLSRMKWSPSVLVIIVAMMVFTHACSKPEQTEQGEPAGEVEAVVTVEAACEDGVDEDGDGDTDCEDSDCSASEICEIVHCKKVCAEIFECDGIIEACTEKELVGVLAGCQASCKDKAVRSQVSMADGVPCFVIGGVFLDQVQGDGLCLGDDAAAPDQDDSEAGDAKAPSA